MPRGYAWSTRVAASFVAIALVGANAVVRGGVDLPLVAVSAVAAAAMLALAAGRHDEARTVPVLVLGLAAVVAFVGLQVVPLPAGAVRGLSPRASEILDEVFDLVGGARGWRPLSLDPGETALELAKATTFACVVAAAALLAGSDRKRDRLLRGVALSGVAVSAVYFGGAFLLASPLLEPRGTFVNPNHLAGFLQLACWPALGFALRAHGRARVAWIVAFAFSASAIFLTLSRAGIAAFFVAAGVFSVLWIRTDRRRLRVPAARGSEPATPTASLPSEDGPARRRPEHPAVPEPRSRRSGPLVAAVAVAAALAISAWLALGPIVRELESVADTSKTELKLSLWPLAVQMVREYPLTGIGRGAYASTHTAYLPDAIGRTFTHVENEWLQLPVDLGLLAGTSLIALFVWAFVAAARRRDLSRPFAGALAGAAALAAHNVFDFSLELPGVAIPFGIVLGIAARDMPAVRVPRWVVRLSAAVALLVAAAGLAVHVPHRGSREADRVVAARRGDEATALAREALPWHPSDWTIPAAVGGRLAAEARCKDAVPWLTAAMQRNPTAPQPHHAMARCLARSGQHALAKREYRLAFTYGDKAALSEAAAVFRQPGALLEVAPETPRGLVAAGWVLSDRPEEALEAFRRGWESFQDPEALNGLAWAQLVLKRYDDALSSARLMQQAAPLRASGYVHAARALDALGRADDATSELELGARRIPGSAEVLVPLGSKMMAQRRHSQARAIFNQILVREGPVLATKHMLIARTFEGQGRYQEALQAAQTARDIAPHHVAALLVFSRSAAALGLMDEALQALAIAAKQPDAPPDIAERIAAVHAQQASRDQRRAAGVR